MLKKDSGFKIRQQRSEHTSKVGLQFKAPPGLTQIRAIALFSPTVSFSTCVDIHTYIHGLLISQRYVNG